MRVEDIQTAIDTLTADQADLLVRQTDNAATIDRLEARRDALDTKAAAITQAIAALESLKAAVE